MTLFHVFPSLPIVSNSNTLRLSQFLHLLDLFDSIQTNLDDLLIQNRRIDMFVFYIDWCVSVLIIIMVLFTAYLVLILWFFSFVFICVYWFFFCINDLRKRKKQLPKTNSFFILFLTVSRINEKVVLFVFVKKFFGRKPHRISFFPFSAHSGNLEKHFLGWIVQRVLYESNGWRTVFSSYKNLKILSWYLNVYNHQK